MSYEDVKKVWMNGKLVDFADAKIHAFSHVLHYGSGMFEGLRVYKTKNRNRRVPARRAHRAHVPLLQGLSDGGPVLARRVQGGDLRDDPGQRIRRVLRPSGRLPWARRARRQPVPQPGRRADRRLEVGQVPRRGGDRERRGRLRLLLEPHGAEHVSRDGEGDGQLPELRAHQDGSHHERLHGGDRPGQRRAGSPRAAARTSSSCTGGGS